jgi:hypothetical protein
MAWVEIIDVREPATTDWRLFRHVRQQIRDAAQKVPGLNLREMACYVDDGGTLATFDLSRLRRHDQEYIGFEFDGGECKDVKRRHVLPSAELLTAQEILHHVTNLINDSEALLDTRRLHTQQQHAAIAARLPSQRPLPG